MQAGTFITSQLRLVRLLGQGGMGSVWLADHVSLCTQVVVKFCQGDLAARRSAVARFQREAALAARAKGPHVVQVHDFGQTHEGVPYIAMEYLQGEDIGKRLQRDQRISPSVFADWLDQIAKGLCKAHRAGIVHRDIKPENLFLCEELGGTLVKVLDFGLAKGGVDDPDAGGSDTKTGAFLGTIFYMSPEQIGSAKHVDRHADLWSLTVVAYYALTGVRPFNGVALAPLISAIRSGKFAIPSQVDPGLPKDLDAWMRKGLSVNPERRFHDALEMASAFRSAIGLPSEAADSQLKALNPRGVATAPLLRWSAVVALLAAVVVLGGLVSRAAQDTSAQVAAIVPAAPASAVSPSKPFAGSLTSKAPAPGLATTLSAVASTHDRPPFASPGPSFTTDPPELVPARPKQKNSAHYRPKSSAAGAPSAERRPQSNSPETGFTGM